MTNEEAIVCVKMMFSFLANAHGMNVAEMEKAKDLAVKALRDYHPDHIDREAWEPCGDCEKKSCDNCRYSEYLSYLEPCKSCENASDWKPMQNFCGECGRPLTEEAWAMLGKRLLKGE